MVIDHAERMGLAQLHQLRPRVGRGAAESMCVLLFQQPLSELARARLKIIFENTDGFEIAQQDLRLRGPGELLGARQSGVPMLRFADLGEDDSCWTRHAILPMRCCATFRMRHKRICSDGWRTSRIICGLEHPSFPRRRESSQSITFCVADKT